MFKIIDYKYKEKESCLHSQAANMLFAGIAKSAKSQIQKCEVLPKTKNYLCYVGGDAMHESGIVYSNGKTLRPKCYSCKGKDCCYHLKIHKEEYQKQETIVDATNKNDKNNIKTWKAMEVINQPVDKSNILKNGPVPVKEKGTNKQNEQDNEIDDIKNITLKFLYYLMMK